jgi:hypothetical protein
MLLTDGDLVYHAHFRHIRHTPKLCESNGKLYDVTTECVIHSGACLREKKQPCLSGGGVVGRSKKSVLDGFDRHKGHFQAFQRALNAMTTNRALRRTLFTEYWSMVRKPKARR